MVVSVDKAFDLGASDDGDIGAGGFTK